MSVIVKEVVNLMVFLLVGTFGLIGMTVFSFDSSRVYFNIAAVITVVVTLIIFYKDRVRE